MKDRELRYLQREYLTDEPIEFRAEEQDGKRYLSGYAVVYNRKSVDLGGFTEIIRPGAFREVLNGERHPRVMALFNHNSDRVLGSYSERSKTLQLEENQTGVKFNLEVPDTATGDEVWKLVQRGDLAECSFAFRIAKDGEKWHEEKGGTILREIYKFSDLLDISVVTHPAYPATSVSARALETAKQLSEKPAEDRGHGETGDGNPTADHELENLKALLEIQSLIHPPNENQEV